MSRSLASSNDLGHAVARRKHPYCRDTPVHRDTQEHVLLREGFPGSAPEGKFSLIMFSKKQFHGSIFHSTFEISVTAVGSC